MSTAEGLCELKAAVFSRSKLSDSELQHTSPQKNPKKVVVKSPGFPYFFLQMHRLGAGVNGFYPEMHVPKKYNNKQQLTSEEPDEV